jgi:hypothetical protein
MMKINKIFFMKIQLPWVIIFLLAVLLAAGCSVGDLSNSSQAAGSVLFQDDFSDPSSGWLQGQDEFGLAEYAEGGFRIFVASEASAKISIPRLQYSNVRLEVETQKIGGGDDNDYGLICRYKDQDNFYFFTISSDGYYGIGKFVQNKFSLIGMDMMQTSDLIRQGEQTNLIRADCVGDLLTFYINGSKTAEVRDTDFKDGDVGLIAGTFSSPGTDILFKQFRAMRP